MPEPTDWARLAAFIDGEGNIEIKKETKNGWTSLHYRTRVRVVNTDLRMAYWIKNTFGFGTVQKIVPKNPKWMVKYQWMTSCRKAIEIIKGCYPYFVIKREQADVVLQFAETFKHYRRGIVLSDECLDKREQMKLEISRLKHELPNQTVQ